MSSTIHRGLAALRTTLPNGAVVIAKQSPATPAVTINLTFGAGSAFDPLDRPGVAHFVSRTIDRGTSTRAADDIADELDGRGVSLTVTVNRHVLSLVCTCLVDDLSAILTLLADITIRPVFPSREVETRRGEILTLVRQDEDNPAVMASEGLLTLLYGEAHPYGRRPRGSLESVGRIDRDAVVAFHAARFAPATLSLVMVGDVEPSRAIAAATAAFEPWEAREVALAAVPDFQAASGRRVRIVRMMNKAQADVAYGFTTIRRSDPQYYAYWLMNNILGQYALGGRLGDRIRERDGMAYYAFSALDANVIPGPLMIRAGVNAANVDRAIAAIDEELEKFANDGPTDREVADSKQYLIGSMPRNLETNAGIAQFLQTVEFFQLGLDYDVRLPVLLDAVTRDQVHQAAQHVLAPSSAAIVVAGPYAGEIA